jgi:hypothetical protein
MESKNDTSDAFEICMLASTLALVDEIKKSPHRGQKAIKDRVAEIHDIAAICATYHMRMQVNTSMAVDKHVLTNDMLNN